MTKYIEYFQIESKSLLKRFKQKDPATVALCKKYFESKEDISLMNTQHIIAKEYGFDSWNDLIKQEPHKLAESLIVAKNKILKNAFFLWHNNSVVSNLDRGIIHLSSPEHIGIDMKTFTRNGSNIFTLEHIDVSEYDLSGINPLYIRYSEDTKWPEDPTKLPLGFNPKEFLESRKNPGLGIRTLHKQNIKGKGQTVVVISQNELVAHIEYCNSLIGYEKIGVNDKTDLFSNTSTELSAMVGKSCGIAPLADAYYYTVNSEKNTSYKNYVVAIKKAIELHKKLKSSGKSGVSAIILTDWLYNDNIKADDLLNAISEANDLGIMCFSQKFTNLMKNTRLRLGGIYCKLGGDVDNPDDYVPLIIKEFKWKFRNNYRNALCFPCGAKTVSFREQFDGYAFEHFSSRYDSIYAIGLYLLAKSVKETITPYEFFELGLKTGDFREGVGTIINPVRLIESLK